MRSAWTASGAALAVALGVSLGAAVVALGSAGDAWAQGVANKSKSGASSGYRRLKGRAFRPAPRVKRSFYRAVAPRTCGQFHYWSRAKGTCLDARTSPPALK
jgi:hypothetical protein